MRSEGARRVSCRVTTRVPVGIDLASKSASPTHSPLSPGPTGACVLLMILTSLATPLALSRVGLQMTRRGGGGHGHEPAIVGGPSPRKLDRDSDRVGWPRTAGVSRVTGANLNRGYSKFQSA